MWFLSISSTFPYSRDDTKREIENKIAKWQRGNFLWLLVCKNKIKDNIGSSSFMDNDSNLDNNQEKELFCFLTNNPETIVHQ